MPKMLKKVGQTRSQRLSMRRRSTVRRNNRTSQYSSMRRQRRCQKGGGGKHGFKWKIPSNTLGLPEADTTWYLTTSIDKFDSTDYAASPMTLSRQPTDDTTYNWGVIPWDKFSNAAGGGLECNPDSDKGMLSSKIVKYLVESTLPVDNSSVITLINSRHKIEGAPDKRVTLIEPHSGQEYTYEIDSSNTVVSKSWCDVDGWTTLKDETSEHSYEEKDGKRRWTSPPVVGYVQQSDTSWLDIQTGETLAIQPSNHDQIGYEKAGCCIRMTTSSTLHPDTPNIYWYDIETQTKGCDITGLKMGEIVPRLSVGDKIGFHCPESKNIHGDILIPGGTNTFTVDARAISELEADTANKRQKYPVAGLVEYIEGRDPKMRLAFRQGVSARGDKW